MTQNLCGCDHTNSQVAPLSNKRKYPCETFDWTELYLYEHGHKSGLESVIRVCGMFSNLAH